ncbi:MAG: tRNA (N6-isopentenyl adenosine(37)-C2)-methylthiotransferase MiaB [Desulfovibrionaceae bacterium]|nr:tRNA (N6-isopentenyl adenosine(37)-C2)-methylthiotransferase MiaB [Desulfovibrionaceae bacterium]MBF0514924.1 tRNA (N6-isopentenyl adenosine(37)-C2)-methylthiotransferase MiaB [Desulfovibrionaceae bacterium]
MRYHIVTFGCQMNAADSDWLSRRLDSFGWEKSPERDAEVFIVNTCSVRDKPEQKVYSVLGRLAEHRRANPRAFAAVGGCVAQQIGAGFFKRFPMVRLVFGADGVAQAPEALARLAAEPGLRLSLLDFIEHYPQRERSYPDAPLPAQAYVSIMQGCDNFCAYCIVPYVRGRQKSRPAGDVLAECRELTGRGVKEITLLGQNVNSYGQDRGSVSFAALLREVCAVPGLARVRFVTSHPKDLADEVIAAFGECQNLCPSLHLPMQSGSDAVLRRMGRKYTARDYLGLVDKLRRARADIALSTDVIVGFPGESEEDFLQTLDVVRQAGFDSAFSFMYCDRPGVAAAKLTPKVPEEVKAERLARLHEPVEALAEASLAARVGRRCRVLIEGPSKRAAADEASWRGRDEAGRTVNLDYEGPLDLTGKLVSALVREAKRHSLRGSVEEVHD